MEVPVHVWRVGRDDEQRYLLILRDDAGNPLWMTIGPCEAMAIWNALRGEYGEGVAGEVASHDLLCEFIGALGGTLVKVVVDDFWHDVYYAKLHISVDSEVLAVDSRPSDAVAIALRLGAPLFANDTVWKAANHPMQQEEQEPPSDEPDLWDETDEAGGL